MPRHFKAAVVVLGALAIPGPCNADEPRRFELGAELGYALPGASLERGSRTSDVTFGLVELGLDGAYRFHRSLSAGLSVSYGSAIPTLCGTTSECISSLGHDLSIEALGRWHIGTWGKFRPDLDLGFGYEWFGSELMDSGTSSSRWYRGFQASIGAQGQFEISRAVSIGPAFELAGGLFSSASLSAPGVEYTRETNGTTFHLWMLIAFRTSVRW